MPLDKELNAEMKLPIRKTRLHSLSRGSFARPDQSHIRHMSERRSDETMEIRGKKEMLSHTHLQDTQNADSARRGNCTPGPHEAVGGIARIQVQRPEYPLCVRGLKLSPEGGVEG